MDERIGGRAIFSEEQQGRLVNDVVHRIADVWPDLGSPHQTTARGDDKDAANPNDGRSFSDRDGVCVQVSETEPGTILVAATLSITVPLAPPREIAATAAVLGPAWQWSGDRDSTHFVSFRRTLRSAEFGGIQQSTFREQIGQIKRLADILCPVRRNEAELAALKKSYENFEGTLIPVLPWFRGDSAPLPSDLRDWAEHIVEFLQAGLSVAIDAASDMEQALALAAVAEAEMNIGSSLALPKSVSIPCQLLLSLTEKAPGTIAVPARTLSMATNLYELNNETTSLLSALSNANTPCVFFGAYGELQNVFHGGQSGHNDPLSPVVCHLPDVDMAVLSAFAADHIARNSSAVAPGMIADITRETLDILRNNVPREKTRSLIGPLTRRIVATRARPGRPEAPSEFVRDVAQRSETLGGLSVEPRGGRAERIQQHFLERITSPGFFEFLTATLFGQEEALASFISVLRREAMTRTMHQPWRLALQGTPGIGKSDCLSLLARWCGIPYVIIDAASMPDPHTASSQLLGSGRGIVGSFQAGRLQQIARHFNGAIVEIADLDHAEPSVRSSLGDLFLQVLETGEAQSATGAVFSCANLLFGFTLNLPDGKDERVFQRVGFGNTPTQAEIRRDVCREIRHMVSGAFLSRIGEPILFAPLTGETRVRIVERALRHAVETALNRMGASSFRIDIAQGAGQRIVEGLDRTAITFGARGLVERARAEAARIVVEAHENHRVPVTGTAHVALNESGSLELRFCQDNINAQT